MSKGVDEHRLYKTLGTPLRLVGLTLDELVVGVGGFFLSMIFLSDSWIGLAAMVGSFVLVYFLKKAKRRFTGARLRSFLYWHGLWMRPSRTYPPFHHRVYRP
jgi:type IV conjugative transfer system protein TraL